MILEILTFLHILSVVTILAYLARHFVFTLTVLMRPRINRVLANSMPEFQPTVTILIPAHNEERVIGHLLKRMSALDYPHDKLEVIVIDDASKDYTRRIAEVFASKYYFIKLIHRDFASGKAAAMNAGFRFSTGEIILCFDADYLPQKNIVPKLVSPFCDPKVGAVQGRVVVQNEPQNLVTRLVALERIGGYRVDQEARGILGLIPQFGGTVGGFRRSVLEQIGGWDESILAEDTDLTFQVCLANYKVAYVLDAESYEEAVDNWRAYWRQRTRWARGHMQCCFKYTLKVLKSRNLNWREKIDGLFILYIYFMPLVVFFSLVVGIPLVLLGVSSMVNAVWLSAPISIYSLVGNFAPFFEVGIGVYLDGRARAQWLVPLLLFTFLYSIPISGKALLDLLVSKIMRRNHFFWDKTVHSGNGNCYIET